MEIVEVDSMVCQTLQVPFLDSALLCSFSIVFYSGLHQALVTLSGMGVSLALSDLVGFHTFSDWKSAPKISAAQCVKLVKLLRPKFVTVEEVPHFLVKRFSFQASDGKKSVATVRLFALPVERYPYCCMKHLGCFAYIHHSSQSVAQKGVCHTTCYQIPTAMCIGTPLVAQAPTFSSL